MGVITRIRNMLEGKILGYEHIYRTSAEDEPTIADTRLTVTRVVRNLERGTRLDMIDVYLNDLADPRITRVAIEEAVKYYRANQTEIDGFIDESIKRGGTEFRTQ